MDLRHIIADVYRFGNAVITYCGNAEFVRGISLTDISEIRLIRELRGIDCNGLFSDILIVMLSGFLKIGINGIQLCFCSAFVAIIRDISIVKGDVNGMQLGYGILRSEINREVVIVIPVFAVMCAFKCFI